MSMMAPIAFLTIPGRRDPHSAVLLQITSLGQGGVINIWPVETFETLPVIKGYTKYNLI
jgi:hypothetical protein